jgi:hypothetical protein
MNFKHLDENDQTYFEHFKESIYYSYISFKSSMCFLIHAFWPDLYVKSGSSNINKLDKQIKQKYSIKLNN